MLVWRCLLAHFSCLKHKAVGETTFLRMAVKERQLCRVFLPPQVTSLAVRPDTTLSILHLHSRVHVNTKTIFSFSWPFSLSRTENHYEVDVLKCFPGAQKKLKTFLLALVTETPDEGQG